MLSPQMGSAAPSAPAVALVAAAAPVLPAVTVGPKLLPGEVASGVFAIQQFVGFRVKAKVAQVKIRWAKWGAKHDSWINLADAGGGEADAWRAFSNAEWARLVSEGISSQQDVGAECLS